MLTALKRSMLGIAIAGAVGATAACVLAAVHQAAAPAPLLADAEDNARVEIGKGIYRRHCASCHGRYLQGQPLWQVTDEDAGRRAPAHDESGHTWQHSDQALFHMTKHGRFATADPGAVSHMPAFEDVLSDADILAVIAFIKRRWPLGLRISQAMLNPRYAGMPADASRVAWKLPPTCMATVVRRASSR
ncbi:MAG: cytochrome c [Xanthobacteraceae bacterium]|jgi:mono/diheme cytochrome c family protein